MVKPNHNVINPLELRIDYLTSSSMKLFNKLPTISHYLMRCALRYSTKAREGISDLRVCKKCGILLVPCSNLEIRCKKTNKRNRKRFKRKIKKKTHKIYYKNKMVYKCKKCNNIVNLPGVSKFNKS